MSFSLDNVMDQAGKDVAALLIAPPLPLPTETGTASPKASPRTPEPEPKKKKQHFKCHCGSEIAVKSKRQHMESKKHLAWVQEQEKKAANNDAVAAPRDVPEEEDNMHAKLDLLIGMVEDLSEEVSSLTDIIAMATGIEREDFEDDGDDGYESEDAAYNDMVACKA